MEQLGRIPEVGDRFAYEDLQVTVTETDHHRVMEVEIQCLPRPQEAGAAQAAG